MVSESLPQTQWTPRQRTAIDWYAQPFEHVPPRLEDLAAQLGVTRQAIGKWRRKPGWQDAVNERSLELVGDEVPALIRSGIKYAKAGKYQFWAALLRMAQIDVPEESSAGSRVIVVNVIGDDSGTRPWIEADAAPSGSDTESQALQRPRLGEAHRQNGNRQEPHNGYHG